MRITYRNSRDVSATAVLRLFRRNEWREWFTLADTEDLLRYALFITTAWHGRRAVGIATLYGDGRFYAHLDTLLVDESYRRQGIGTALMKLVIDELNVIQPHYCDHTTHEEWLVRFYERLWASSDSWSHNSRTQPRKRGWMRMSQEDVVFSSAGLDLDWLSGTARKSPL